MGVLTPERATDIQAQLGSDIAMVLDECIATPADRDVARQAMERSIRWAARARVRWKQVYRGSLPPDEVRISNAGQAQFGIVQGATYLDLRSESVSATCALGFDAYAIGGLSVGEPPEVMYDVVAHTAAELPQDRPRYLMGVGRPEDLVECIGRGIDMFDCVMPTRNGRNALAFTDRGPVRLRNASHEIDQSPLDADCPCPACQHSRGYLRHLFQAREMLGPILTSIHNLTYYQRIMAEARQAIEADSYAEFRAAKLSGWRRT